MNTKTLHHSWAPTPPGSGPSRSPSGPSQALYTSLPRAESNPIIKHISSLRMHDLENKMDKHFKFTDARIRALPANPASAYSACPRPNCSAERNTSTAKRALLAPKFCLDWQIALKLQQGLQCLLV